MLKNQPDPHVHRGAQTYLKCRVLHSYTQYVNVVFVEAHISF